MSSIFDKNYALSGIEEEILIEQALVTLLWSEYDWAHDSMTPLDELFDTNDFSDEAVSVLKGDLFAFIEANADDLDGLELEGIAHDFILTRNGHGTGFWDRGYPNGIGDRLSEATKPFGEIRAYQGDDGKLYLS
jgi:hypothetical protein